MDDVKVKDELEIGYTELQQRILIADQTSVKIEQNDAVDDCVDSKPVFTEIFIKNEFNDHDYCKSDEFITVEVENIFHDHGTYVTKVNELLAAQVKEELDSDHCLEDTGCQDSVDTNTSDILKKSPKWETEEMQWAAAEGEARRTGDLLAPAAHPVNGGLRYIRKHTGGDKTLGCDVCAVTFSNVRDLKIHRRIHIHSTGKTLSSCDAKFKNADASLCHEQTHPGGKHFGCHICTGDLVKRKRIYNCVVCNKKFMKFKNLKKHKQTHIPEKPFSCNICAEKFDRWRDLKSHKRAHFRCKFCHRKFEKLSYLNSHKRRYHTGEPPVVFEVSCEICNEKFRSLATLLTHKRSHPGEKPYNCQRCSEKFSSPDDLKSHKRIHIGEKPFTCEICDSKFSTQLNLSNHHRIHTAEKPFGCETCTEKFRNITLLRDHMRTHAVVKFFSCEICNSKYRSLAQLKIHKRQHRGVTAFSCEICKAKFRTETSLISHKQIHPGEKPYSCCICSGKFSNPNELKSHKRTHIGESFSCEICNVKFDNFRNLKSHNKSHAAKGPFTCDICSAQFNFFYYFRKHKLSHNQDRNIVTCDDNNM